MVSLKEAFECFLYLIHHQFDTEKLLFGCTLYFGFTIFKLW
eukprot:UN11563